MGAEVATIQTAAMSRYDDQQVISTIKQTVCKGATDAQLSMFLQICKRTGLDPFLKEIWFVAEKSIIMAARDGYLRVANEHPMFDGIETRVERNDSQVPIKAVCTVWRKDRTHPTISEAYYNEYKSGSPVWSKYPSAMISKVAEVLALKRSFAINGVVSEDEMDSTFHPPAPTPTQSQVAERKISEMKAGKTYSQVSSDPMIPPAAPFQATDDDLPPNMGGPELSKETKLQEVLRTFTKFAVVVDAFASMKQAFITILPESEYYRVLADFGMKHGNDFKTMDNAKRCFSALWGELEAARPAVSE